MELLERRRHVACAKRSQKAPRPTSLLLVRRLSGSDTGVLRTQEEALMGILLLFDGDLSQLEILVNDGLLCVVASVMRIAPVWVRQCTLYSVCVSGTSSGDGWEACLAKRRVEGRRLWLREPIMPLQSLWFRLLSPHLPCTFLVTSTLATFLVTSTFSLFPSPRLSSTWSTPPLTVPPCRRLESSAGSQMAAQACTSEY